MTGRERIRRLLDRVPVDRTPVLASMIAAAAEMRGIPQNVIHRDPRVNAETLLGVARDLGLDGAYISSDNWIIHSALGGEIDFPEDDEPMGRRPVLDDWGKLDGLAVPDPESAGRMPFMLRAARRAVELNTGGLFLEANVDSGAFAMAGILRGTEQLMLDVSLEPQRVHRLLEFCTRVASAYGAAMARTGVDAVQFGDSTASLVSRQMYDEFVKPYQPPVVEAIRQAGAYPFLHVCGNSTHLSGALAETGATCVEIDAPADLRGTVAAFADRAAVRGNVPTMLLRDGTPDQVERSARQCLEAAGSSRFILSPGCGVPRGTPTENIRALVRVAHETGPPSSPVTEDPVRRPL